MQTSNEEELARAALMVLRSGASSGIKYYVISPASGVINPAQAISTLASLSKPVECSATGSEGTLTVKCQAITDPGRLKVHRETSSGLFSFVSERISEEGAASPDAHVIIRTKTESMILSVGALQKFLDAYRIKCAVVIEKPDQKDRRSGAAAILAVDSCIPPAEISN